MSRWRIALLVFLLATPVATLTGLGGYFLWERGLSLYAGWIIAAFIATAYFLGWHWHRHRQLVPPLDFTAPLFWTDRDRRAWQMVAERAKAIGGLDPERLSDVSFYATTAQELALELARVYHPGVRDPFGPLTIPELLAVVELASHDLAEMVGQYIPGGHLLTIQDLRHAKKAADWYQTANNAYWLISALFSPVNTGARYAASQLGVSRPWQLLQQDLFAWLFSAYLHRLGHYLIELNSGRLRVGATRYRELAQPEAPKPTDRADGNDAAAAKTVQVTLLGQVKAGKSSLVNALLGEQRAATAVIPCTNTGTRYELAAPANAATLALIDTPGYHQGDVPAAQVRAVEDSARASDLLLLVLHARNPARQADANFLRLRDWFGSQPHLKMPPVLGVLTHIDLLSPAMEWQPPYNWQQPQRTKEKQIAEAMTAVRETLGVDLAGLVPVCTAEGRVTGVQEELLPAMMAFLPEASAVALLRCLHQEADAGKVRKIFSQLLAAGKQAAKTFLQWKEK